MCPWIDIIEVNRDDNFNRIILKSGKHVIFLITMLEPEEITTVFKFLKEVARLQRLNATPPKPTINQSANSLYFDDTIISTASITNNPMLPARNA